MIPKKKLNIREIRFQRKLCFFLKNISLIKRLKNNI